MTTKHSDNNLTRLFGNWLDVFKKKNLAPFLTLALLLLLCCIFSPVFRKPENLLNIANQVAPCGLLALGMTLVIAGGGIDLSVGSLFALAGVLGIQLMGTMSGSADWVTFCALVLVALLTGLAGGAVNGALVNWGRIPPFIATLGTFSIFRSLAIFRADASTIYSHNKVLDVFAAGGVPVLILTAATAILFGVLAYTRFGWRICAVGSNEKASVYASVNVRRVRFASYVIVGALCGLGTVLQLCRMHAIPSTTAGNAYELDAIAAVIIGGTPMTGGRASIFGTLCGVLILGIIGNILDVWNISSYLYGTVKGVIIIMAVLLQYKRG